MKKSFRSMQWMVLMLVLGCFGSVASAAPPAQMQIVEIRGMKYQPDVVTVQVGETVQWKNDDIFPHTVTAVDKSFSSPLIRPGGTWKFVAKKAGTFPYGCTPHPNMHGKLIVK